MSLENLDQKIHDPSYKPEGPHEKLPFTPKAAPEEPVSPHAPKMETVDWTESSFQAKPIEEKTVVLADPQVIRRRKIAIISGAIALLLLIGGTVFKMSVLNFTNDKVTVSITGPKEVESNTPVTFKVLYENRNWADLEDVTLVINHPSSFRVEGESAWKANEARAELTLGKVPAGTKGTVELRGTFHAFQNQVGVFQSIFRFTPEGVSSQYDVSGQWTVSIGSSLVTLEIEAPLQVGNDQTMEYAIEYKNESGEGLDNMRLKLEYPDGFRFVEADPKPSEGDNTWYVGNIVPAGTGKIKVRGMISGIKNDIKHTVAKLGKPQGDGSFFAYAETEKNTRIIASPLTIMQTVNGLRDGGARVGEMLNYTISFKNEGDIGLRDLILSVDIDTKYLNMGQLRLDRGAYNVTKKQILFRAADVPTLSNLAPGQGGEVTFSVPVRNDAVLLSSGGKNLTVETIARIDSPDVPTPIGANKVIASNVTNVKLLSTGTIGILGYYYDANYPNTGPIPPKVGEETTFTMHVRIASNLNDIVGSRVSIGLPSNVRYVGSRSGEGETVAWNERTGELVWEVGTLVGGAANAREFVFQVGIMPDVSLVGNTVTLIKGAVFTGKDGFGNQDMRLEADGKTTHLYEDPLFPSQSWNVIP